jgi:hypothetical protein
VSEKTFSRWIPGIDVIATVLATALAAPMTVNAMARMTGRDAMMIG